VDLKETGWIDVDRFLSPSEQGPAADTYEDSKELFNSIKSVKFLDKMRDFLLVMKGRVP
jgi:hypothetical protein